MKILIKNITWDLEESFYDELPTEFEVVAEQDEIDESGSEEQFVNDWIDYNGSKWGATADDFDFEIISK